jgi:hypothetical protein
VGSEQWRVGISIPLRTPLDYDPDALGVGWVTNWHAYVDRSVPTGVEFAQMVRMKGCQLSLDLESLTSLADAKIPSATPTPVSTEDLTQFVIDLQQDTTLNITSQIP